MVNSRSVNVLASLVPTQLSVEVYPGSGVPWPQTVYGKLFDEAGNPLEGKTVRLVINDSVYGTAPTYPDGSYGFFSVAVGVGAYTFLATFEGDVVYGPSSAETSATFQKVQAALSIDVSPTSGYVPLEVTIQGYLTRSDTGAGLGARTVKIYRDTVLLAEVPTSYDPASLGYYYFLDRISDIQPHSYYAQFPGDNQFAGCAIQNGVTAEGEVEEVERTWLLPIALSITTGLGLLFMSRRR